MQNPPSSISSLRPAIAEFPPGLWRIVWLGGLRPTRISGNPVGYDLKVHLVRVDGDEAQLKEAWTPLGNLVFLRIQSLWYDGVFHAHPPGKTQTINGVDTLSARFAAPWSPGGAPHDHLLQKGDYDLHKLQDLAPCWVMRGSTAEVIVPAWEVLRAWYLFDPRVMPAMLAGALSRPASLRQDQRLWLPGTAPEQQRFVRPFWMSDEQAVRVARLLFYPAAKKLADSIYRQLYLAKDRRRPPGRSPLPLPIVRPPMQNPGFTRWDWIGRCQRLTAGPQGPRYLMQSLDRVRGVDALKEIFISSERDAGENRNDPDLAQVWAPGKAPIHSAGAPDLTLRSAAPDPALQDARIEGFDFHDSLVDAVTVHRVLKPQQKARFHHFAVAPQTASGGAVDHAARPQRGVAGLSIEGGYPPLSAEDLLQRSLAAFELLIATPDAQWQARPIAKPGFKTFPVRTRQHRTRHFAILEVHSSGKIGYILEAQRLEEHERLGFCLCRHISGVGLSAGYLETWLSQFPAKRGHPWTGDHLAPQISRDPRRVHHLDHDVSTATAAMQLAVKLKRRVHNFLLG